MNVQKNTETAILFAGDILFWGIALWLTLFVRELSVPEARVVILHLRAFGFIFAVWAIVFFIADLYKSPTLIVRKNLPNIILRAQVANSIIAVLFFYFIPYFGITPRTNLFIDLFISFILVSLWRIYLVNILYGGDKSKVLLIGRGSEVDELATEIEKNPRYRTSVRRMDVFALDDVSRALSTGEFSALIADLRDAIPANGRHGLLELLFSKVKIIDVRELYEEIFDRVPLSLLSDGWFLENIYSHPKRAYNFFKRSMDIVAASLLGLVTLPLYPLVAFFIKLDTRGPVFTLQTRIGQDGKCVTLYKFRTMTKNDMGKWGEKNDNKVTRIGAFLRRYRIDEPPQLWNVFRGDVSLIGPRPEFPEPVEIYKREIPYYQVRHLIQPGLSGWAQIYAEHPHHKISIEETRNKLAHDLYYVKNRGLWLDLKIALKTVKILFSREGI